ncbi:MAG: translocation/assembly module TamB domain-containing protein [Myxococcota bacterium]|nr:translocation/assembly module TamB domain-containing protein [Myxococcota bacterium]
MDTVQTLVRKSVSMYQRVSAFVILAGAFVCLVYFLGYFALNSRFTNQAFDVLVNSKIRGQVAWTRLAWGPWPSDLKLLEPVLVDSTGRTVIEAKSLTIRELDILGLFDNRLSAQGVHIDAPVTRLVSLVRSESGSDPKDDRVMNIAEMFWSIGTQIDTGDSKPLDLDLTRIKIRNAIFILDHPSTSIIAHGIQIPAGRFRSYSTATDSLMAIEIEGLKVGSIQVRVAKDTALKKPLYADPEDVWSWSLRQVKIDDFNWNDEDFNFSKLRGLLRGDPFFLEGFKMELDRPEVPYLNTRLRLDTDQIDKHINTFVESPISGPATIDAQVSGEADDLDGIIQIGGTDLNCQGVKIQSLQAQIEKTKNDAMKVNYVDADLEKGRMIAHGEWRTDDDYAHLSVFMDDVPLDALPVSMPTNVGASLGGRLTGHIFAEARHLIGDTPLFSIKTQLETLSAKNRPFGLGRNLAVDGYLELQDNTFDIQSFKLSDRTKRLGLKGKFDLDTFLINIQGQAVIGKLSPLTASFGYPTKGRARIDFGVKGFALNPRFHADINATRVRYGELPKSAIKGKVAYQAGLLDFDQVSLKSDNGSIGFKGRLSLSKPGKPMDFRLNARQFELASLPFIDRFSGRTAVDVRLRGPLSNPRVTGRGRIARPCWKTPYGDKPLCFRRVEVVGDWSGEKVKIETLKIEDRRKTLVDLSGNGHIKRLNFSGQLKINGVPLDWINHFVKEPLPIAGRLVADVTLSGNLKTPSGQGQLSIVEGEYGDYKLGRTEFEIRADKKQMQLTGQILDDLRISASTPLVKRSGPGSALIEFDGFGVEDHLPQLSESALKSKMTGRIELKFDPFKPALLEATANLKQLQTKYAFEDAVSYSADLTNPVQFKWDGTKLNTQQLALRLRILNLEGFDQKNDQYESTIRLDGDVYSDGRLEMTTRGKINLGLAMPFLNSVFSEASGELNLDGSLKGFIQAPEPDLKLVVTQGEFVPRAAIIGSQLDLLAPARFAIEAHRTDSTSDEVNGAGDLKISLIKGTNAPETAGEMRLMRDDSVIRINDVLVTTKGFTLDRIRVGLSGSEIGLNVPRVVRGTFDTPNLVYESWIKEFDDRRDERRMKVSGEIDVIQGEYLADLTGVAELNQGFRNRLSGRTQTRTVSVFERIPSLKRLMLDLSVVGEGGFYIRNRVLTLTNNLEIGLDLEEIKGFLYNMPHDTADERLAILGTISVLPDSTITYARREFDVSNGVVNFGGRNFLDAQIEANRTFTLRTGQSVSTASTSFDSGSGDIRLEEVVLSARLAFPTRESPPSFAFDLSSNSGASKFEVVMLVLTGSYPENLSGAAGAQPATEVVLAPLLSLVERPLEDTFKVDLTLTPLSTGTLYIDANKVLSRRLYLYSRVLVGEEQDGNPQQFGLRYQINNVAFGELSNERLGSNISTTGRLKLRVNLN